MSAFTPLNNGTVDYKFNNREDFIFYILNAVAHDFIHDFNNYGRMAKILNYIMGLVRPAIGEASAGPIEASMSSTIAPLVTESVPDSSVYDSPVYETPVAPDTPDVPLELNQRDDVTRQRDIAVNVDINDDDGKPKNTMNITEDIPEKEMYNSQIEENFSNEEIGRIDVTSSDTVLQNVGGIVNTNINNYNEIKSSGGQKPGTRNFTKKMYLLQNLKEFVQECIFLVISKLKGGDATRIEKVGGKKIKQKGGSGIDIISKSLIIDTINDIIGEINEIKSENLMPLVHSFEYIMYSFSYLSIPNISPLEILNNSLIEESICIFIIGQCNTTNISEQAKLCLKALLSSSDRSLDILDKAAGILPSKFTSSKINTLNLNMQRGYPKSRVPYAMAPYRALGGAFNGTEYRNNKSSFQPLISAIDLFKQTQFYIGYSTTYSLGNHEQYFRDYNSFVNETNKPIIQEIVGINTFNVKNKMIMNSYTNIVKGGIGNRKYPKYFQDMVDTIKDLIITKTIEKFEDVLNRENGEISENIGDTSFTPPARRSVQNVSRLIATKVLELTGMTTVSRATGMVMTYKEGTTQSQSELAYQAYILRNVSDGYRITSIDDSLIDYFIEVYEGQPNIKINRDAITELNNRIRRCTKSSCRVINNAISATTDEGKNLKQAISNIVVCPTSSICDGMGSFGSCVPVKNKEFANMNFTISYPGERGESYYGQTNIKPDNSSVNINYGYTCGKLVLYNSIDIKIDTQPVVLEANYVFKNLINQIIAIWKTQTSVTDIDLLWKSLYKTDYFLSILKLGSQKSVGDIFQEINSTLYNGGYNQPVQNLITKQTYGLMGDRPSGVRIIKLLRDSLSGKNANASGGYIYDNNKSIVYFSQPISSGPRRGGKITRKKQNKIKITKSRRHVNSFTKKRKNKINRRK
jgi:hypothetical protein